MRFHRVGDYEVVTRITGPDHHFLGLRLTSTPGPPALMVEAIEMAPDAPYPLKIVESDRIIEEVNRGLDRANARLGTDFHLSGIRYCSSDRFVEGIYAEMAETLVEHVAWSDRESPTRIS